jgi:hypothetical protein
LTYAPAVELRYLGDMAELDHVEIAAMYLSLRKLVLAFIGTGVGGGFTNTNKLKVINFQKATQSPDAKKWLKEIKNGVCCQNGPRFS